MPSTSKNNELDEKTTKINEKGKEEAVKNIRKLI